MTPSISVVLPMYNEAAYARRSVDGALAVLVTITDDYEIVIVDDCSNDGTAQIVDAIARKDPHIKVIHNDRNRTLGGSLRVGYAAACKDLILYTDADLPFDLNELSRAARLLEYQQATVLSAYRFDRTAEGPLRALYSFCYNLLVRVAFGIRVKDVNFSFKLFKRSLLDRFTLRSEGSFIDAEFLIRAFRADAHVIQMGVDYFPRSRGISTLSSPSVIVTILKELVSLRRELR